MPVTKVYGYFSPSNSINVTVSPLQICVKNSTVLSGVAQLTSLVLENPTACLRRNYALWMDLPCTYDGKVYDYYAKSRDTAITWLQLELVSQPPHVDSHPWESSVSVPMAVSVKPLLYQFPAMFLSCHLQQLYTTGYVTRTNDALHV